MRPLTQQLAAACETANPESRCTCRCNGNYHGTKRQGQAAADQLLAYIVQLPPEDPHFVVNKRLQLRLPEAV